jgi:hypothetical protein
MFEMLKSIYDILVIQQKAAKTKAEVTEPGQEAALR